MPVLEPGRFAHHPASFCSPRRCGRLPLAASSFVRAVLDGMRTSTGLRFRQLHPWRAGCWMSVFSAEIAHLQTARTGCGQAVSAAHCGCATSPPARAAAWLWCAPGGQRNVGIWTTDAVAASGWQRPRSIAAPRRTAHHPWTACADVQPLRIGHLGRRSFCGPRDRAHFSRRPSAMHGRSDGRATHSVLGPLPDLLVDAGLSAVPCGSYDEAPPDFRGAQ